MRLQLALPGMIFAFLLSACLSASATPVIEFEKTTFDIGKPSEGEKASIRFTFRNTGDTELEIQEIVPGCGCTDVKTTETKVLPGKSAAIQGFFNTSGYRGKVTKSVTVKTNDPNHSSILLSIAGEVVPIAVLKPERINFQDMKVGTTLESKFSIIPQNKKFKIVKVESAAAQRHVEVLGFNKTPDAQGAYNVKFRISAGDAPGRIFEQLNIVTDLPGNAVLRFLIYGNVIKEPSNAENPS